MSGGFNDFLEALRWKADQLVTNPFGERVWLKQMPDGLTDCCDADDPCERHAGQEHA
jgi:hypothetical protein